jgi:hypothetical protein
MFKHRSTQQSSAVEAELTLMLLRTPPFRNVIQKFRSVRPQHPRMLFILTFFSGGVRTQGIVLTDQAIQVASSFSPEFGGLIRSNDGIDLFIIQVHHRDANLFAIPNDILSKIK